MDRILQIAVPVTGVIALVYAFFKAGWIKRQDAGNATMQEIAGHIAEGAIAFLRREYRILAIFVVAIAVLLGIGYARSDTSHALVALSFVVGAFCSALAGFIGMKVATRANVRTANAARTGLASALQVAFSGGLVMGLCVVGLGVLGLSILYTVYSNLFVEYVNGVPTELSVTRVINILTGFSLGASSIALFARVGGGIYTKAADVGADLAGKVYEGIPEDDPRNPATIADNVGDNVGDVAGMGADLFESYVGSIIGTMVIGVTFIAAFEALPDFHFPLAAVLLPLALAGAGILASIVGAFLVRTREGGDPQKALNTGELVAALLMFVASYFIINALLPAQWTAPDLSRGGALFTYTSLNVFFAVVIGIAAGTAIGFITEYYCSAEKKATFHIAKASITGSATNIIAGLAIGMKSTGLPIIVLAAAIIGAASLAGLFGIAIAAVGMLSVLGIQLAVDAYGPISDNSGGIAEMSHLPPEVRQRTDKLDAVGNTTAAIGKGFAIGSAALTALALFAAYMQQTGLKTLDVSQPFVMGGLFIGAMLPFVFSAIAMEAVGRAAADMIKEVGRQFNEIKGLREGTAKAEYAKCVDISTKAAIREMVVPGVLAVAVPVIVGFIDYQMLGGLLAGVTVSGVLLAIFQANAGGAWDNAKKRFEAGITVDGQTYKKGSDAHKAAVVGDTVGDPLKDTSGPSINILMKLIAVVALVIAPILVNFHGVTIAPPQQTGQQLVPAPTQGAAGPAVIELAPLE
jgi:K(+)-stimulated pyrophosphate-energized sodium pump